MAWRWTLGTLGKEEEIKLLLQALPCDKATVLKDPGVANEGVRGVVLVSYPVAYSRFKDAGVPGVKPTLFSKKPEDTLAQLKQSPEYAFRCVQLLARKILARQNVTR